MITEHHSFSQQWIFQRFPNHFFDFMDFVDHRIAMNKKGFGCFRGVALVRQIGIGYVSEIGSLFLS